MSKLRISHLTIQPVLVWDDGEELSPGPELAAISLPLSRLGEFTASLPDEVANLQGKIEADGPGD